MENITVPVNWSPRPYQRPLWNSLNAGVTRAVCVWHRRAGKDTVAMNWTVKAALQKPGVYYHMLPTQRQARQVIWDGIDKFGRTMLSYWPESVITQKNDQEMKIRAMGNGGQVLWQCVGSDNYDRLVGTNPLGIVFSEWALANPKAWEYFAPILRENGGWALFIYTPRGRNHGYTILETAKQNDDWFHEVLTVKSTGVMTEEDIETERRHGHPEEIIQQEYYCSFDAPLQGAYYGSQMMKADREERITHVPHDEHALVDTWWDLGISDSTAIWWVQRVGREFHAIDYYEAEGEPLSHYVRVLRERATECGYEYGEHLLPHDVKQREISVGRTKEAVLRSLGLKPTVVAQHRVDEGIEHGRRMINMAYIDAKKCERGIECLRSYRKEAMPEDRWEAPNRPIYKDKPLHDWASHGADAWRYGAVHNSRQRGGGSGPGPIEYPTDGREFI